MKIGDVYLVGIPTVGGHEQEGLRPAVIVQSEERKKGESIGQPF